MKMKNIYLIITCCILAGCSSSVETLPHTIETAGGGCLEFDADRSLIIRASHHPENPNESYKMGTNYSLILTIADNKYLSFVGERNGKGCFGQCRTLLTKKDFHRLKPEYLLIDGKEMQFVSAWRKFSELDSRFVIQEISVESAVNIYGRHSNNRIERTTDSAP